MAKSSIKALGIISESDTKLALGEENHDRLFRTVTRAFERMQEGPVYLTKLPHTGHLTNAMHALMVDEARDRFSDIEGVDIIDGQTFLVKFADRLLVRFKKIDPELKTANYPTTRAMAFDAQSHLPDLPPVPRVTIGYEPDTVWANLVSVAVLFPIRKRAVWSYELTGKSNSLHAMSPLAETVIVKPKKQLTMEELFSKKPR